jgi:hypothetical protein
MHHIHHVHHMHENNLTYNIWVHFLLCRKESFCPLLVRLRCALHCTARKGASCSREMSALQKRCRTRNGARFEREPGRQGSIHQACSASIKTCPIVRTNLRTIPCTICIERVLGFDCSPDTNYRLSTHFRKN